MSEIIVKYYHVFAHSSSLSLHSVTSLFPHADAWLFSHRSRSCPSHLHCNHLIPLTWASPPISPPAPRSLICLSYIYQPRGLFYKRCIGIKEHIRVPLHLHHYLAHQGGWAPVSCCPHLWHKHPVNGYALFGFDFYVGPLTYFREGPTFWPGSIHCLRHMLPLYSLFGICNANNILPCLYFPNKHFSLTLGEISFFSLFQWIPVLTLACLMVL